MTNFTRPTSTFKTKKIKIDILSTEKVHYNSYGFIHRNTSALNSNRIPTQFTSLKSIFFFLKKILINPLKWKQVTVCSEFFCIFTFGSARLSSIHLFCCKIELENFVYDDHGGYTHTVVHFIQNTLGTMYHVVFYVLFLLHFFFILSNFKRKSKRTFKLFGWIDLEHVSVCRSLLYFCRTTPKVVYGNHEKNII